MATYLASKSGSSDSAAAAAAAAMTSGEDLQALSDCVLQRSVAQAALLVPTFDRLKTALGDAKGTKTYRYAFLRECVRV